MRKLIFSINMTLDGFCDHTAVIADEELHQNANELLKSIEIILFGRVTYQLMESSWPPIVKKPTGIKSIDEFAVLIDNISKLVFSNSLKKVEWKNTRVTKKDLKAEVLKLKQQPGKDILVGSPSLLIQLMHLELIDEFRFCVHPIILGKGLPLFKNIRDRIDLNLIEIRPLASGAATFYYAPVKK
jgi:dihydrofolate reductase